MDGKQECPSAIDCSFQQRAVRHLRNVASASSPESLLQITLEPGLDLLAVGRALYVAESGTDTSLDRSRLVTDRYSAGAVLGFGIHPVSSGPRWPFGSPHRGDVSLNGLSPIHEGCRHFAGREPLVTMGKALGGRTFRSAEYRAACGW